MLEGTGDRPVTPTSPVTSLDHQEEQPVSVVQVDPLLPDSSDSEASDSEAFDSVKRKVEVVVAEEPSIKKGLSLRLEVLLSAFPKMVSVNSEGLRRELVILTVQVKSKKYAEGLKTSEEMLEKARKETPENSALIQYLESMYLICLLNGSLDIVKLEGVLSDKNREERIEWYLATAKAAATGSDWIQASKNKELYCYRNAADHGSVVAKQKLVREVLFSETPATSPFMDCEALRIIKQLSLHKDEHLLKPVDDRDKVILELVRLVRSEKGVDLLAARTQLEKTLTSSRDVKLIRLAPWLYVEAAFGPIDPAKVTELSSKSSRWQKKLQTAEEKKYHATFSSYWEAVLILKTRDRREGLRKLKLLQKNGFAAATVLVAREYRATSNYSECLKFFTDIEAPYLHYTPDLAYAGYSCYMGYTEYMEEMGGALSEPFELVSYSEKQQILKAIELLKISNTHCLAQAGPTNCMDILKYYNNNLRQLPAHSGALEKCERLDAFYRAVEAAPFSLNPEMLILRHYAQMLKTGTADDHLVVDAIALNPVAALYRMSVLWHASSKMTLEQVLSQLVHCVGGNVELLEAWHEDPEFSQLVPMLRSNHEFMEDPEAALKLAIALGDQDDPENIELHLKLAWMLEKQKRTAEANEQYRLYRVKSKGKYGMPDPDVVVLGTEINFRQLPAVYLELNRFNPVSYHPFDVKAKCSQLSRLKEALKDDLNLQAKRVWIEKATDFLANNCALIEPVEFESLQLQVEQEIKNLERGMARATEYAESVLNHFTEGEDESSGKWLSDSDFGTCSEKLTALSPLYHCMLPLKYTALCSTNEQLEALAPWKDVKQGCQALEKALEAAYDEPEPQALILRSASLLSALKKENPRKALFLAMQLQGYLNAEKAGLDYVLGELNARLLKAEAVYLSDRVPATEALDKKVKLQEKLTAAVVRSPELIAENLTKVKHGFDAEFFKALKMNHECAVFQVGYLTKMMSVIPVSSVSFVEGVKSRLSRDPKSLDEVTRIPIVEADDEAPFTHLLQAYFCEQDCVPVIQTYLRDKKVSEGVKANLILAAEAFGIIGFEHRKDILDCLKKKTLPYQVSRIILAATPDELPSEKTISELQFQADRAVLTALGKTYLKFGQPDKAYDCYQSIKAAYKAPSYEKSMLEWRHGFKPVVAEIPMIIAREGGRSDLGAQCRLFDWLCSESICDYTNAATATVCYRHLAAPSLVHSPERDFYLGAALYQGVGCDADEEKGLEKMREALNSPSPVPAFRLVWMTEHEYLPSGICQEAHPVDLLAQKVDGLTPERVDELVFSLGVKELQIIISAIKAHVESSSVPSSELETVIARLESGINRWKGVYESPEPSSTTSVFSDAVESGSASVAEPKTLSREDELTEELGRLVLGKKPLQEGSDTVFNLLLELRNIQGARFPDFDDQEKACAALLPHIPMNEEEGLQVVRLLYPENASTESKSRILETMLYSFYLDDMAQDVTLEQAEYLFSLIPEERLASADRFLAKLGKYLKLAPGLSPGRLKFLVKHGSLTEIQKLPDFACQYSGKLAEDVYRTLRSRRQPVLAARFMITVMSNSKSSELIKQGQKTLTELIELYPDSVGPAVFGHVQLQPEAKHTILEKLPKWACEWLVPEGAKLSEESMMLLIERGVVTADELLELECGFDPALHSTLLQQTQGLLPVQKQLDYILKTLKPDMPSHDKKAFFPALAFVLACSPDSIGKALFVRNLLTPEEKLEFFDSLPSATKAMVDSFVEKAGLGQVALKAVELIKVREVNLLDKSNKAISGEVEYDLVTLMQLYRSFKGSDQDFVATQLLRVMKRAAQNLISADKNDRDRLKYRALAAGVLTL
ncbi:tetratricopeptide repeat protein [Endozoicomonas numazuensis]|uniref:Uncharacterized protein n=1 Tax=Endozoicomonas numazuensis TaxID=1137799 RepID=A0A081NFS4_9GAMM|nr:hypothetical protein [Endozoicomonas numazuensis]KEQ17297.1 hypothetical protein GZ78_15905 [Endozoicomonas numazuensis]